MKNVYYLFYVGEESYVFRETNEAMRFLREHGKRHDFKKVVKKDKIGNGTMICYCAEE